MPTKIIDRGFNRLMRVLNQAVRRKPHVRVGIRDDGTGGSRADSDLRNVDLAFIHEFGTAKIPERSHFRAAFDENRDKLSRLTKKLQAQVFKGNMTMKQALAIIGEQQIINIKKKIRSGIPPPLSPVTIARRKGKKGKATPLIDTGEYINSITAEVKA